MNTYLKGKAIIVKCKGENGEFVPVLGQTGGSISREVETIEIYTKDDVGKQVLGTYESFSVSLEGLYVLNDEGYKMVEESFNAKENVELEIAFQDHTLTGLGLITSMSMDIGQDDMVTYSMEIAGTGTLTRTENEGA